MSDGTILLATRSAGKLRELQPLFVGAGYAVVDVPSLGILETAEERALERYETFEENALAKARYFARVAALPAVADDSGIEVVTLDGRPGVRSKRWAGRDELEGQALDDANNQALLAALGHVEDRRARYVCVAAFVQGSRELTARGVTGGVILPEPRGRGGFGYDPYFLSDELGATFAEASPDEKATVSHRGRAFRAMFEQLALGR